MEVDDENVFVVLQRQGGCVISGLFLQCFFVFLFFVMSQVKPMDKI